VFGSSATAATGGPFPPNFAWGVATSAFQIEGSPTADGRSPSIWDTYAGVTGNIADASTAAVACDHYRRWEADLDLMKHLGIGSYRFSISWPRIMPRTTGRVNCAGLGFYDRLVDGLVARGITPVATLFHWDLLTYFQDAGGWENRDSAGWFVDCAHAVFAKLGDRVGSWVTINENRQQGRLVGDLLVESVDRCCQEDHGQQLRRPHDEVEPDAAGGEEEH
jgi:beta-glucosidase